MQSPDPAGPLPTVTLRWRPTDTRFIGWLDAACAVGLAIAGVAGMAVGRPAGAILVVTALLPGYVAVRAKAASGAPAPTMTLQADGSIVLEHPLLSAPFAIVSADVHSVWVGPFDQPAPRPRDRWVGPRRWPSEVLDASQEDHPQDDTLLVSFGREIDILPPLVISPSVWALHRQGTPLWKRKARGLRATFVERADAETFAAATGRSRPELPDDVRAWLA